MFSGHALPPHTDAKCDTGAAGFGGEGRRGEDPGTGSANQRARPPSAPGGSCPPRGVSSYA
jgi:hypothetical protein